MKCGIYTNTERDKDLFNTKKLIDLLERTDHKVLLDDNIAGKINDESYHDAKKADILFVLGGDGTILRAARKYGHLNIPLVGINIGHLGFMSELSINEVVPFLECIKQGDYKIDERMMLEAEIKDGSSVTLSALNDIVITRANRTNMVRLNIYIDGELTENFCGDGLIITTPTGSTAYSLAAGGPIAAPNLKCIIITPICGHSLYARSMVVDAASEIKITLSETEDDIAISADGADGYIKSGNVEIIVKSSNLTTKFLRTKKDTFFTQLQNKLAQWKVN